MKMRSVTHHDQLTVVDHLDELRQRLFICLAGFLLCFFVAMWQQQPLLKVLNRPLNSAQEKRHKQDFPGPQQTSKELALFSQIEQSLRAINQTQPSAAAKKELQTLHTLLRRAKADTAQRQELRPITLGVAEPFTVSINIAFYMALIAASPLLLMQLYAFAVPALTTQERRSVVPLMIATPALFVLGVVFAYMLVLPRAIGFLQQFNAEAFLSFVQAKEYYRFILVFLGGVGLLFEVPIAVLVATHVLNIDPKLLQRNRGIAILIFAVIAAILTPTPDPVTMLLALMPLVVLYEISLWIVRYRRKKQRQDTL